MIKMASSIEEQVEDWCKKQLQKYFTKTQSINEEIDNALKKAPSKKGGEGANYPDIKCFINYDNRKIPVMIECKGTKGDFIKTDKLGRVSNLDKDGEIDYKSISKYAVNGAIHYTNAILNYTESYKEGIAVGVNGFYEDGFSIIYEIGVYYISKDNLLVPKKVYDYTDLSFLNDNNVEQFLQKVDLLKLTEEEKEEQKLSLENRIEISLKNINQKMHDDLGIVVGARVKLVAGLIMAGLGVKKVITRLKLEDLRSDQGPYSHDGVIIINKIKEFLSVKNIPEEKKTQIIDDLQSVFIHSRLQEAINGESKIKTVFGYVEQDILPFLSSDLHNIDFTGKLFNVLNEWVDVPDGDKNDVVLTPRQVTQLMARLARVDRNSYVWDYATGSAGFLISAMHIMIQDAKDNIKSEAELREKINHIKAQQLLGIEKLADIYLLAVLNMILMGDGSSNIIHKDSLTEYEGKYEQGVMKGHNYPANVFLLNPPYSAKGKGLIFAERAFSRMEKGYGVILIQENAGSGQGEGLTNRILLNNTLVASIKMPVDLFIGKSAVQTAIYVFEIGKPHNEEHLVKFIDFSNDGYARQSRKKSNQSKNLRDSDHAKERYDEIVNLVLYGPGKNNKNLNYYKDCYVEDYIALKKTYDNWTYAQHRIINLIPNEEDFRDIVKDYITWRLSYVVKKYDKDNFVKFPSKKYDNIKQYSKYKEFVIGDLFEKIHTNTLRLKVADIKLKEEGNYDLPALTAGIINQGLVGFVPRNGATILKNVISVSANGANTGIMFYQPFDFTVLQDSYAIRYCEAELNQEIYLYLVTCLQKAIRFNYDWSNKAGWNKIKDESISLPVNEKGDLDFDYMTQYMSNIIYERIDTLKKCLTI